MVGSELPTPETRESTVTDPWSCRAGRHAWPAPGGRPAARRHRPSRSAGARSSASPGSRATARPSSSTRSMGLRPGRRAPSARRRRDITALDHPPTAARRGVGYIPEDRHRDGLLLDAPLWENVMLGHQTQPPLRARGLDRPDAAPAAHRGDHRRLRRAHPGHRRPGRRPLGRQPAEADHGPRADRRAQACSSPPTPPAASTSAPRPPSGTSSARPAPPGWPCCSISADLDELIGLSDTLIVIYGGRIVATLDPSTVTPDEPRLLHDRRRRAGDGDRTSRPLKPGRLVVRWLAPRRWRRRSWPSLVVARSIAAAHRRESPSDAVRAMCSTDAHCEPQPMLRRPLNRGRRPATSSGRGRGHRLQDEPVQHRGRGPVPPGRR